MEDKEIVLDVNKEITLRGTITKDGEINLNGEITLCGKITLRGKITLSGKITNKGETVKDKEITLRGKLTLHVEITKDEEITLKGNIDKDGNIIIKNEMNETKDMPLKGKIFLMEEPSDKEITKYKLIFEHLKNMEHRYHTWMNYYSLFNGALFVAFCTILISTGRITETEGMSSGSGDLNAGAKFFYLNCTYWDLLTLIAFIGVIASYCWYLSLIGHYYWINNWRGLLKEVFNNTSWDFNNKMSIEMPIFSWPWLDKKFKLHFHSTQKVTKCFVLSVLWAWILLTNYSWHHFAQNEYRCCCLLLWSTVFLFILIGLEYIAHWIFGSDVSGFNAKAQNKEKWPWLGLIISGAIIILLFAVIFLRSKCKLEVNLNVLKCRLQMEQLKQVKQDSVNKTDSATLRMDVFQQDE